MTRLEQARHILTHEASLTNRELSERMGVSLQFAKRLVRTLWLKHEAQVVGSEPGRNGKGKALVYGVIKPALREFAAKDGA